MSGADPAPFPEGEGPLGLYVHVPFCEVKCAYCHFSIDPRRPDDARQERYLRALLREMAAAEPGRADTLYFGGGTPSLLAASRLSRLVADARGRFALPADAEVTLEANPRDLDDAGFSALRAAGVNRLSLGVQSLDDRMLREMLRPHTAQDARDAFRAAGRAGFASLSLDLILGWPGETALRWRQTLEGALGLGPDHLSLYILEVEGRTALAHAVRAGRAAVPGDDLVADLYQEALEVLVRAGLARYEISNFARPGHESRHNAKYWADEPFLGFGLAAHSYRHGRRWWNRDGYASYCAAVEAGGGRGAVAGERSLSSAERRAEALFTGLRRRDGVELARFARDHGVDVLAVYGEALRRPREAGLLEVADGRLRLTDRGVLVSSEVFQFLV